MLVQVESNEKKSTFNCIDGLHVDFQVTKEKAMK